MTLIDGRVRAGSGEAFNVGQFLEETSPYAWASTGIGLCIGLSVLGAGWYVFVNFVSCRLLTSHCFVGVSSSLVLQSWVEVCVHLASEQRI